MSAVVVGADAAVAARARTCANSGGGARVKRRSGSGGAVGATDVEVLRGGEHSNLAIAEATTPVAMERELVVAPLDCGAGALDADLRAARAGVSRRGLSGRYR